jgi:hypothetical protein
MQGGGFAVDGQGSVTGKGVVIINIPGGSGDMISVAGQGAVSLLAPTSGPYKEVALLQVSGVPITFSGQAIVTIAGVSYTPNAAVNVSGNAAATVNPGPGSATLPPISAAMIAFDLKVAGNGDVTINPDDPPAAVGATSGAPTGNVHAAALDAMVHADAFGGPASLADRQARDAVAASLALLVPAPDPFATAKRR